MTAKILVADDSLTIQKVIGITLASSGYELVECLNELDLFRFVQEKKFDLILLDFNLSDKITGYNLSKEIMKIAPKTPIMIMLGTFDTIEESQFFECGIQDKVIKPFESGKFIKKCRDLIELEITPTSKKIEPTPEPQASENLDLWTVDAPSVQKDETLTVEPLSTRAPLELDPLASELAGWSVDATVNLEEKFNKVFPTVIDTKSEINVLERLQVSSGFVAEMPSDEGFKNDDSTQPVFEIPLDLNQDLISEINDDISPDSFWAVDDIVTIESEDTKAIHDSHLNDFKVESTSTQKIIPTTSFNEDEIVERLKIALQPMIEKLVSEYCKQSVEKVAWEVIPDLAENLIKKELKNISESI